MLNSTDFLSGYCRRSSELQKHRLRLMIATFAAATPALKDIFERTVVMNAGDESNSGSEDDEEEQRTSVKASTSSSVAASPTKVKKVLGDGVCRVTLERPSRRTALDAIASIFKYVAAPPKLFFMCGSECKVMRSADRCRTWKPMNILQASTTTSDATPEGDDADSPKKAPSDAISAILATLPPRARQIAANTIGGERGAAIAVGGAVAAAKSVKAKVDDLQLDLLCIAADAASGHVVACGTRGIFLYSTEKGQNLRRVPVAEMLRSAASAQQSDEGSHGDETASTVSQTTTIRHVAFVGPGRLVVAVGNAVVYLNIDVANATVRSCHVLHVDQSDCRYLLATSRRGGSRIEVISSFRDRIVFCTIDSEGQCLESVAVEHALGTILGMHELTSSAFERLPPPQPLKVAMTADKRGGNTAKTEFSYASETIVQGNCCVHFSSSLRTVRSKNSSEKVPRAARAFAVYTANGRLVPYDATCALWLWTQDTDEATTTRLKIDPGSVCTIVASVSCMSYMPFVQQQSKKEKVGIVALGPTCATWVRSGENGISTSPDYGVTWSAPQLALMSKVLPLDADEAVVFSNKPAVAMLGAAEVTGAKRAGKWKRPGALTEQWQLVPLPREVRMAVVYDATSMQ